MKRIVVLSCIAVATTFGACVMILMPSAPFESPPDYASVTRDRIVVTLSQRDLQSGVLSIRNDSPVPVSYIGYSERQPLYRLQVFRGGSWVDSTAWCSFGSKACTLRAARKLDVEVMLPADIVSGESMRIAVGFSSVPKSDWERVRSLPTVYSHALVYRSPDKG